LTVAYQTLTVAVSETTLAIELDDGETRVVRRTTTQAIRTGTTVRAMGGRAGRCLRARSTHVALPAACAGRPFAGRPVLQLSAIFQP
jgi:hypothetical protein